MNKGKSNITSEGWKNLLGASEKEPVARSNEKSSITYTLEQCRVNSDGNVTKESSKVLKWQR